MLVLLISGSMAGLPHFNPDADREGENVHPAVADLRAEIAAADALLIGTPEYGDPAAREKIAEALAALVRHAGHG
jgi:NAD(P)H-dependent FMN reductase